MPSRKQKRSTLIFGHVDLSIFSEYEHKHWRLLTVFTVEVGFLYPRLWLWLIRCVNRLRSVR